MENVAGKVNGKFQLVQRVEYLKNLCRGKSVLHLGVANFPYTQNSIDNEMLLHFELEKITAELYGFDYDQPGIDLMVQNGGKNLYRADLEKLDEVDLDKKFEVIIAGEMIEHLANPGLFLRGIKRFMKPETNLVITTINAYSGYRFFVYGFKGQGGTNEPVHYDHVAYYSFSTIRVLMEREHIKVNKFAFCDVGVEHRPFMNWRQRIANDLSVKISPVWADGIIAECSLG